MASSNLLNLLLFILLGIYPSFILFRDITDDHDEMGAMGSIIAATFLDVIVTCLKDTYFTRSVVSIMLLLESSLCLFMSLRCIVAVPITVSHATQDPNGGGSLDNYILVGYLLLAMSMIAYHRRSER